MGGLKRSTRLGEGGGGGTKEVKKIIISTGCL